MHRNQRKTFTSFENIFIQESVKLIGENWEEIAKALPGRTPKQVHDRYINYLRDGLKKGPWTKEEDNQVLSLFEKFGSKWTKMINYLPGRSANDIKNRWHKHLVKKHKKEKVEIKIDNENEKNKNLFDLFSSVIINDEAFDYDDFASYF